MIKLKKTIGLAVLINLSISTNAQVAEPQYIWGAPIENTNPAEKIQKIMAADETGFYLIRESGPISDRRIFLEKYDNAYKKIYTKNITLSAGTFNDAQYYRFTLFAGGKFLMFAQTWKKAESKSVFNVREVNTDGDISDNVIELDNVAAEKMLRMGDFFVQLSDDKSKLLLLTQPPFDKGGSEKIRLKSFDTKTIKELWSKDVDFGIEARRNPNNEIAIDNNGDAYLYKEIKVDKGIFKRIVYTYSGSSLKWAETELNFGGNFPASFDMRFNVKGDLIISGFYSHKENKDMEGSFYFRMNSKSKSIEAQKSEPFGKDFLENFMSSKEAAKENAAISEFKFIDVLKRTNGSILLLAEYSTESKSAVPNTGGAGVFPEYDYTYHSKDIIIVCINPDGNKAWETSYKKNQEEKTRSAERKFDSFVYGLFNDRLVILWNNIDLNRSIIPAVIGVPAWYENDGTLHKKAIEFGPKAVYATFMMVIEYNGEKKYNDLKFGLPLKKMHENGMFEMSMNSRIFFATEDGIILLCEMPGESKRYRFGKIKL